MNESRQRFLLFPALIIAILAVSTASILIRFAQRDAPSLVIAALRLTFAGLALAPVAMGRHREELHGLTRREFGLATLSGLFLAVHFATWVSSLEFTSVASSVVFVSTGPLWVALLSPVFLNERLSRAAIVGLGIALGGATVIGLSDACIWRETLSCPNLSDAFHGRAMLGNFLALAGAWALTGYLMIGRHLRAKMSLVPYVFLVYGMASIGLLALMVAAGEKPFGFPPIIYLWLILLALVPQLIGHSTYNWALRFLPAAFVAATTLGEPIGSTILAYFILKEVPSVAVLVGGTLILAGIYLAARADKIVLEAQP